MCTGYSKGLKVKLSRIICNAQTTIMQTRMQLGMKHLDGYKSGLTILWTSCIQLALQNVLRRDKGNLTRAESTYQHAILSWTHVQLAAKLFETSSTHSDDRTSVFVNV